MNFKTQCENFPKHEHKAIVSHYIMLSTASSSESSPLLIYHPPYHAVILPTASPIVTLCTTSKSYSTHVSVLFWFINITQDYSIGDFTKSFIRKPFQWDDHSFLKIRHKFLEHVKIKMKKIYL